MAGLQSTLEGAARNLREMTPSQKAAIILGGLLVCASLVWMVQWAAVPEMTPLISQDLSDEELAHIRSGLDVMREPYRVSGSRVLVHATANRGAIMAQLQQMDKMPTDLATGFAEMVRESNPWLSQEENNKRWTVALKTELERVLRQFNGVRQAHVFLNLNGREKSFSRNAAENKASITLISKTGEPISRTLAMAAARLVSGAVRGLPLRNVEVVDGNGRAALEWDAESPDSAAALQRLQKEVERDAASKISRQLDFDRNVRVNVQVVLDSAARTENESRPIEGVEVSSTSTEKVSSKARSGAAGIEANVGASVSESGGEGETERSETKEAKFQPGVAQTVVTNPSGAIKQISAAIALSHSYLAGVVRRKNPDKKEVLESDIQAEFALQKPRIENQIAKLVLPQEARQVAVDWYYDAAEAEAPPAQGAAMDSSLELAQRYGPAAGLGTLAVVALGFMLRMAKRGGTVETLGVELGLPRDALDAARKAAADLSARAGEAGSAARSDGGAAARPARRAEAPAAAIPIPLGSAAEGVLEGQEIEERMVQITNMIDQVGRMAEEDEEGVAALVERWVDQAN